MSASTPDLVVKLSRMDCQQFLRTPRAHVEFSMELKKEINRRNLLTTKTRKTVFDALDEIKNSSEEQRIISKKEKALTEIIMSEKRYLKQLEILIHFFMEPVEERNLLGRNDFLTIFGHIETIYKVNKKLLEELDNNNNVPFAFSKITPFFKLYSAYANDFKKILSILQNARALNPQFATFVENQESRPEVQSKLSALLITPIQRIPRYKLLLSQLHQLTRSTEDDYGILSECLEKINGVAEHINRGLEDQENMQRLLELQRYLRSSEPIVIKPGRKLLKEGILMRISKNGHSHKLYTFLMNDIIMFNKMKKDELAVNSLKCSAIYPLGKSNVTEILDKGCMKIVCQDEEVVLYHKQLEETKNWINKIKEAIETHLNDRRTLRMGSSSRRPVKRKDLHEYNEVGLSPGKPMKKRRTDLESNGSSPSKVTGRRPIGTAAVTSFPIENGINNKNIVSLAQIEEKVEAEQSTGSVEPKTYTSKEIFLFGKPQPNQGFRFTKFLSGVKDGIKNMFGFKN